MSSEIVLLIWFLVKIRQLSWFGSLSNVHFRLRLLTKSIKNDNCVKFYSAKLFRFLRYNQNFFGCWFSLLSLNLHFFILRNQKLAIISTLNYIPFTMKFSGHLNYMITWVRYDNRKRKIRKIDSSMHPNSTFLSTFSCGCLRGGGVTCYEDTEA